MFALILLFVTSTVTCEERRNININVPRNWHRLYYFVYKNYDKLIYSNLDNDMGDINVNINANKQFHLLSHTKKGIPNSFNGEKDLCDDKICGEVCDTSDGMMHVMRYCQPDGSCAATARPDCIDLCASKLCGEVCDTSDGMMHVMRYCQRDGSCDANAQPDCTGVPTSHYNEGNGADYSKRSYYGMRRPRYGVGYRESYGAGYRGRCCNGKRAHLIYRANNPEEPGGGCVKNNPRESELSNGGGSVYKWIQTVDGLDNWEKNLLLGDAYLNTSANSEKARARFTLGLLALHNFLYDQAVELFGLARRDEKECSQRDYPMALWGTALASKYMLWSGSNCEVGKNAVLAIPKDYEKYVTHKEAALVSTVFELFPKDKKCEDDSENQRERRFTEAMGKFVQKYPDEVEGLLFHGLAKLSTLNHKECEPGNPKLAACQHQIQIVRETLKKLYPKYPTHTGLIHYILHANDSPKIFLESNKKFIRELIEPEKQKSDRTALGIKASYDYLKIAKSSCHGIHMPSHIFMRIGNWKMSLKSNLDSIKVGDEYAKARGFNFTYDKENVYHSVEYAQNDFIQLGRYRDANKELKRIEGALLLQLNSTQNKTDETVRWFQEYQFRMEARQVLDTYKMNPQKFATGAKINKCLPGGLSVVNDDLSAGTMTYTAVSESGAMFASGFSAASDHAKSSQFNGMHVTPFCIREMQQLSKRLEGEKFEETMIYTKQAVKMLEEMLSGVLELAEAVRPNGFENIEKIDDNLKENIIRGHLKKATIIQDQMVNTAITITLLFIPSYEIYGHVLLMFRKYSQAKEMFVKSIETRMGRINSLVGLARSNAVLGNEKEASYFYNYVMEQLSDADKGNLYRKEAKIWSETKSTAKIRNLWKWPYV